MADKKKDILDEENEGYFMTLTDEVTGEEKEFELYARATIDGTDYFALAEVGGPEGEYVILRGTRVGEDVFFETVDDDDEYERVEDYMGDLLFGEVDYDDN